MIMYSSTAFKKVLKGTPVALVTLLAGYASPALAAGTAAGATISNTASASYNDNGGNPVTVPSNTVDIKVDELIDVTVTSNDPGDVATVPGGTSQVLSFTVTNIGNGSETFTLASNGAVGGDQYDPTTTSIVIDSNGNGVYDAGVDTVYTAGVNDPVLAADASVTVFVLSTTPIATNDGDRGIATLTATSNTGTGAPGTSIAGAGQGGGDAVIGSSGGDGVDDGTYLVQQATVAFAKTQSVVDPFGGSKVVPGSIITYTLVATISGTGSVSSLAITDAIPAATTYQAGTLTLQAAGLTDATDADAGEFSGTGIAVRPGAVPAGQSRTVTFKVRVN